MSVNHLNMNVLAAIRTGGFNANSLIREDPADRQGFKASLCKPPLVPLDTYEVLRWQVIKWRKGCDMVCSGAKPHGRLDRHQVVQ